MIEFRSKVTQKMLLHYQQSNRATDRRTDRVGCRVACPQQKNQVWCFREKSESTDLLCYTTATGGVVGDKNKRMKMWNGKIVKRKDTKTECEVGIEKRRRRGNLGRWKRGRGGGRRGEAEEEEEKEEKEEEADDDDDVTLRETAIAKVSDFFFWMNEEFLTSGEMTKRKYENITYSSLPFQFAQASFYSLPISYLLLCEGEGRSDT